MGKMAIFAPRMGSCSKDMVITQAKSFIFLWGLWEEMIYRESVFEIERYRRRRGTKTDQV